MNDGVFRKEVKYPISVMDFAGLQRRLQGLLQPDPHGGLSGYRVRSLYFDSLGDDDLFDVLEGRLEKRKIRLRFYPPNQDKLLLEYKCKYGSDTVKHSLALDREKVQRLMIGDYSALAQMEEPLARRLYLRLMNGGYRPKVVIEYHRMAYLYPVSNTRITFDSRICASYAAASFLNAQPPTAPVTPCDMGVLEVKYDHFLVGLLKEVLAPVDAQASAHSKYALSRFLL